MRGMDNFIWHITKLQQSVIEKRKKITVAIPAPVFFKCFNTVWQRQNELLRLTFRDYTCTNVGILGRDLLR